MRIARDASIAGYPAREVKAVLRAIGSSMTREAFQARAASTALRGRQDMDAARVKAGHMWDALLAEGLLVPVPDSGIAAFQTSEKGIAISQAHIGAGYSRLAAEGALERFVQRCAALDEPDSIYPFRVGMAILFGSHAAGKERVGDADLWLLLLPRSADQATQQGFVEHFQDVMHRRGVRGPGGLAQIWWPQEKTYAFLKGRSRILSFVTADAPHLALVLKGPHRVVYPPDGQAMLNQVKQELGIAS